MYTHTHAVPDLPVCEDERAVPQCCVVDFILERLNITEEDFLEGLRDQLRERFQNFEDIANRLRQCEILCHNLRNMHTRCNIIQML